MSVLTGHAAKIAALTAATMVVTLVLADGVEATSPAPTQQPFGAAPANIASYPNGAVLQSRRVQATLWGVPLPAAAWQVQYKTIDNHNAANAYLATILIPTSAWRGNGPRPLVSYQTAEDGVAYKCSPSYGLTAGLAQSTSTSGEEPALMLLALQRGWAVVAPDYEGPYSEFGGALGSAHGVLDGIRAARNFAPASISRSAPWGSGVTRAARWPPRGRP